MKRDYTRLEKLAAWRGCSNRSVRRWLQDQSVAAIKDPSDKRCLLIPVERLPQPERARYYTEQAQAALAPLCAPGPPEETVEAPAGRQLAPLLPFMPPAATAQHAAAPPPVPSHLRAYVDKWVFIAGECTNGTWRRFKGRPFSDYLKESGIWSEDRHKAVQGVRVTGKRSFMVGVGKLYDVSPNSIYARLKVYREAGGDINRYATTILPKSRPGRSNKSFFRRPENDWMAAKLTSLYLTQARPSIKDAHHALLREIEAKQRAAGLEHAYNKPSLHQSRTYLSKIDRATLTLAREGEKAYNDRCAPYMSRCPDSIRAGELWVTDQKLYDVRLRDGGNRLGRVWGVNVLDVSSWRWLGCAVGPHLSSDLVMDAYAMALLRAPVPLAVYIDLGKEFTGKRFGGGAFTISGEKLFGDSLGLWDRLGVRIVKAIGRNPQSKTIERWHREVDRWTRQLPGWCGSNPDERPEKLSIEEAEHYTWLSTGRGISPLLPVSSFISRFIEWAANDWNARHRGRGKYRQGMTPDEAWNTRLPAEGLRRLSADQVDYYTSERRFVKVARGGQVNLTFYGQTVEYVAPELFLLQGEQVEVLVSRSNPRQVRVIYPVEGGTASCVAHLKPQHEWLPEDREELRLALRCRAALKRAIKRGVEAGRALDAADNPIDLVAVAQDSKPLPVGFGARRLPARPPREKPRFANERAAAVLATLEEEERA